MSDRNTPYRGRFAPSPTGPLHFGSLVAAVGSYLDARQHNGQWLVRMEDLDPPREVAGASKLILQTLEQFGFEWDGAVVFQSARHEIYLEILAQLEQQGLTYRCGCSRKQIAEQSQRLGLPPGVYPGTCRNHPADKHSQHAIRLLSDEQQAVFEDRLQGTIRQDVAREVGDFVLRRADGHFAYQLAVVVDDALQGITDIVRGSDLLDSTPRQLVLQQLLGYPPPRYCHLPIAVNSQGQKLSKQTFASAIDPGNPIPALWQALRFLGQHPPAELLDAEPGSFWRWAIEHWQADAVPRTLSIAYPGENHRQQSG